MKRDRFLLFPLLMLLLLPTARLVSEEVADEPLQIAVFNDLTGGQSSIGQPAMNGFLLGLQQFATGLGPAFVAPVDTRTDDSATLEQVSRYAPLSVAAAGFTNNNSLLIAGPVLQQRGTPFLSIGATDPSLPTLLGDNIFLACFGDNTQAAAGAEFAAGQFGKSAVLLWDSGSAYTTGLKHYFRSAFEALGGKLILAESYDDLDDVHALAERIRRFPTPPDFIYLSALPSKCGEIVEALRKAGVNAPILGGDGLDTPEVRAGKEGPNSGVWFTTHAWLSPDATDPETKAFLEQYRAAYGHYPEDAFAALGYDAAAILLQALKSAGSTDPARVIEALRDTNHDGVTGNIRYPSGSRVPDKTVWIVQIADGNRFLAGSLEPENVPPPVEQE